MTEELFILVLTARGFLLLMGFFLSWAKKKRDSLELINWNSS